MHTTWLVSVLLRACMAICFSPVEWLCLFLSWCEGTPAYGAQSVPARLDLLASEDDAWELRTMMPGRSHSHSCPAAIADAAHCLRVRACIDLCPRVREFVWKGAWIASIGAWLCAKGRRDRKACRDCLKRITACVSAWACCKECVVCIKG